MTNPTPGARHISTRGPVALVLLCLFGACGALSRGAVVQRELSGLQDPASLRALCGRDPLVPATWMMAAGRAATREDRLALVEQGLSFLPGQPDLLVARVSMLRDDGRYDEQVQAAAQALAAGPPTNIEAVLRSLRVQGLLGLDDLDGAAQEALLLGAVDDVSPYLLAAVHARIAVAQAFLGRAGDADVSLDASLSLNTFVGPGMLRAEAEGKPERGEAIRLLAQRARQRHPEHPDLALFAVWERMRAGDLAAAETLLAAVPPQLPGRLTDEVDPLRARILILQDRVEEGLAILRERLARWPADRSTLAVLLESWQQQHVPDRDSLLVLLTAARPHLRSRSLLAREIDIVLAELDATLSPE